MADAPSTTPNKTITFTISQNATGQEIVNAVVSKMTPDMVDKVAAVSTVPLPAGTENTAPINNAKNNANNMNNSHNKHPVASLASLNAPKNNAPKNNANNMNNSHNKHPVASLASLNAPKNNAPKNNAPKNNANNMNNSHNKRPLASLASLNAPKNNAPNEAPTIVTENPLKEEAQPPSSTLEAVRKNRSRKGRRKTYRKTRRH